MKILITGGAGFLGQRLARKLLAQGVLTLDGAAEPISRIDLLDVVAADTHGDPRAHAQVGDISDPAVLRQAMDADTRVVFHLAAIVSGQAEADFDLGMRINLDASRALLETCRALGHRPRVIFTSSVAVYGGDLPEIVRDDTALNPQSSYGTQKAIAELLLADYTRRGFVDGRVLRLPTISVRPGKPNAAASSFASGMIREPLNGEDAVCPVRPGTRLWLLSPRGDRGAGGGLRAGRGAAGQPRAHQPARRLRDGPRHGAGAARGGGRHGRGPHPLGAGRARRAHRRQLAGPLGHVPAEWLGLSGDGSFADIIRAYIDDDLPR